MEHNCVVIGIGGITCGGKTTIAKELQTKIPGSVLIHQDDYFYPVGSPNLEYIDEIDHYNWDVLSAINTEKLISDVECIIQKNVKHCTVVIVEGTLILHVLKLREICSCNYYLTLPYEVCKARRSKKDYSITDPPQNFEKIVWPMYLKYKTELQSTGITFIDTHENDVQKIICLILNDLLKLNVKIEM